MLCSKRDSVNWHKPSVEHNSAVLAVWYCAENLRFKYANDTRHVLDINITQHWQKFVCQVISVVKAFLLYSAVSLKISDVNISMLSWSLENPRQCPFVSNLLSNLFGYPTIIQCNQTILFWLAAVLSVERSWVRRQAIPNKAFVVFLRFFIRIRFEYSGVWSRWRCLQVMAVFGNCLKGNFRQVRNTRSFYLSI